MKCVIFATEVQAMYSWTNLQMIFRQVLFFVSMDQSNSRYRIYLFSSTTPNSTGQKTSRPFIRQTRIVSLFRPPNELLHADTYAKALSNIGNHSHLHLRSANTLSRPSLAHPEASQLRIYMAAYTVYLRNMVFLASSGYLSSNFASETTMSLTLFRYGDMRVVSSLAIVSWWDDGDGSVLTLRLRRMKTFTLVPLSSGTLPKVMPSHPSSRRRPLTSCRT